MVSGISSSVRFGAWYFFPSFSHSAFFYIFHTNRRREDGREIIARNGTHSKSKGSCTLLFFFEFSPVRKMRIALTLQCMHLNIEYLYLHTCAQHERFFTFAALAVEGEMLWLTKITRSEMGVYLCIASNMVPPSVSKRMKLQVHCKYTFFYTNKSK